jgi:hypothetical protein
MGNLEYMDHDTGLRVTNSLILTFATAGNVSQIEGVGNSNFGPVQFQVVVTDNGEPGTNNDTFTIELTPPAYFASGVLVGGNIQSHGVTTP